MLQQYYPLNSPPSLMQQKRGEPFEWESASSNPFIERNLHFAPLPLSSFLHPPLCLFSRRTDELRAQRCHALHKLSAVLATPESLPIPSYFILLQPSFLYFLIWCITLLFHTVYQIVLAAMPKGSEMIGDYLSAVVEQRSAAVAVMTLSVDPPASSQQRCRQQFATEWIYKKREFV